MTTSDFIDTVGRIRALVRNTQTDRECSPDKRDGMYLVAAEWYRSVIKGATAGQVDWLMDHHQQDYFTFKPTTEVQK